MPSHSLVGHLLALPLFHAEWVLWLLLVVSVISVAIMVERGLFFRRRKIDVHALRETLEGALGRGDLEDAATALRAHDALETRVVLFGLLGHRKGPDAVEDLLTGALDKERELYDRRLDLLATIASNAPFVGLFGTVLGIIRSFVDLSGNMSEASTAVMGGIAEALVSTAVGLLVAIPAVVAYNHFKGKVRTAVNNTSLLARVLLAHLKASDGPGTA
jgi:biopolymer transport protein ExbB